MRFDMAMKEYMFDCKVRKLSPRTIDNYRKQLLYLKRFLEEEAGITEIESVKATYIKQFLAMMDEKQRKPRYINDLLKVYKTFFAYLKKDCSRGNTYHNRRFKDAAEARDLHIEHSDKYGWSHTSPTDALLSFVLDHDLTDILINRNELMGYRVTGTGTHSGAPTTITPKPSSSRKYICPCCGTSVRATKAVNIACLDCGEQMVLAE
ncbi:MAG: site-specific integrase [Candidatus Spyradocola sp.]|nr:site-specific integrase [Candidatus Spyradocola sp.]